MKFSRLLTKTSSMLGIDANAHAVKLVELKNHKDSYHLISCAYIKLPTLNDASSDHAMSYAIQQALKISGTTATSAAIAISDLYVLCKTIELDATLNQKEIAIHLRQLAQQYFNLQSQELLLDFEILGVPQKNSGLMQIRWAAARRRDIESKIHFLKQAGLTTKIIDIDSYAIARAIAPQFKNTEHNSSGIIYISQSTLQLMILHHNNLIYSKAESYKTEISHPGKNDGLKEIHLSLITRMLRLSPAATLQPVLARFLLAGDFISSGLAETLQLQTGVPAQLANPFVTIDSVALSDCMTQIPVHEFTISIGLAMRGSS